MGTLQSYVQYCNELELCKNQRENLYTQKKMLEDMKTVIAKSKKSKDSDSDTGV
jgi:hypothetical protein